MPKEAVNLFYDVKDTGSKFFQKNNKKKIHPYLTQVGGQQIQEKWNTSHSWFVTYFTACSCNGSSKNVLRNLEEVSHF